MGKILVYYVHPDKSIEHRKINYKENKIIVDKNREILFTPEHLFLQKRRFLPPKPCLILLEGKPEPEKVGNPTVNIPNLFPPMTYGEVAEMVKREVAKARTMVKPISFNFFIILVILHIITIIMLIMSMYGVRIA